MPTPDYINAAQAQNISPEMLAQMPEQRRGAAIAGGGQRLVPQHQIDLAMRVSELAEEVRELRRMLAPPSAVILTGAQVAEHFRRLRANST